MSRKQGKWIWKNKRMSKCSREAQGRSMNGCLLEVSKGFWRQEYSLSGEDDRDWRWDSRQGMTWTRMRQTSKTMVSWRWGRRAGKQGNTATKGCSML
jgi:hypothetical protein